MDKPAALPAFNSDLLIDDASKAQAYRRFGQAAALLDHDANAAKRRSRVCGVLAVGFGLIALLIASGALVFHPDPTDHPAAIMFQWANGVAVGFGIVSVAIGLFGVMFSGAKRTWLQSRMITERLRQFHYQHVIANLTAAAAASADEAADDGGPRQAWIARREAALERVVAALASAPDAALLNLIGDGAEDRHGLASHKVGPSWNNSART